MADSIRHDDDFEASVPAAVRTREDLDSLYPGVTRLAGMKVRHELDHEATRFIQKSPFLVIGSSDAEGRVDVSPRGDAPGFVEVRDSRTLAIPDRPGNNRLDTLRNVLGNPRVGLVFMVPGVVETLRINGRAVISVEDEALERAAVNGKLPRSLLVVRIEELFFHCGKALLRSKLFDVPPSEEGPRQGIPSLARLIVGPSGRDGLALEDADALVPRELLETTLLAREGAGRAPSHRDPARALAPLVR